MCVLHRQQHSLALQEPDLEKRARLIAITDTNDAQHRQHHQLGMFEATDCPRCARDRRRIAFAIGRHLADAYHAALEDLVRHWQEEHAQLYQSLWPDAQVSR